MIGYFVVEYIIYRNNIYVFKLIQNMINTSPRERTSWDIEQLSKTAARKNITISIRKLIGSNCIYINITQQDHITTGIVTEEDRRSGDWQGDEEKFILKLLVKN